MLIQAGPQVGGAVVFKDSYASIFSTLGLTAVMVGVGGECEESSYGRRYLLLLSHLCALVIARYRVSWSLTNTRTGSALNLVDERFAEGMLGQTFVVI